MLSLIACTTLYNNMAHYITVSFYLSCTGFTVIKFNELRFNKSQTIMCGLYYHVNNQRFRTCPVCTTIINTFITIIIIDMIIITNIVDAGGHAFVCIFRTCRGTLWARFARSGGVTFVSPLNDELHPQLYCLAFLCLPWSQTK